MKYYSLMGGLDMEKKIKLRKIKKGSIMYKLLGLNALDDPNSQLRKTLDKIAKGDKGIDKKE